MSVFVGIDLGTSGVKCLALRGGEVLGTTHVGLSSQSPAYGWSEQEPEDWLSAVQTGLADLLARVPRDISGIGLSGQMHGLVACDARMQPVRPAMLWNDSRAEAECADLAEVPGQAERTGVPALPGFNAPKMLWLSRQEPKVAAQIAHLLLPKDYVRHWLTGHVGTDRSDAGGTLWFDQAKGAWDATMVKASGADMAWMPEVFSGDALVPGGLAAGVAEALGLPSGLPVAVGAGDAAAGAVGLGAVLPGPATLSLGTSAQLFRCTGAHQPNPGRYLHAFAHTLADAHYQMAAMLNGARPIAWLAGLLGITSEEVTRLARQANTARAPIFLPYLTGERSPHGDPAARGQFEGLEDATGRAELCYAVLEAVAFSMADAAESFGADLGDVLCLGGGAQSDDLLQRVADVAGLRLGRTEGAHLGPALGAAKLAAMGTGAMTLEDIQEPPAVTRWFEPQGRSDVTEARLARYRALYQATKGVTPPRAAWLRS